jgi:hypothetical protein
MNKTAIKNFAVWARNKLIADISYKAGLMGISEDGIKAALPQSTKDMEFYDIGTKEPYVINGEAVRQRKRLAELINQRAAMSDYKTAYRAVIEEVAYTWFNRLIAIRFMEVNDYLPSRIRALSSESGSKLEPDLVTTPFDAELELSDYEKSEIVRLKNDNLVDECFRMLFVKQCNALNEVLPMLFENTADYSELLLNVSVTDQDGVVYHLVHDIPEDDFNISKIGEDGKPTGQVEIIGWLYQYYNTEPKDEAFALLKKNVKITKERIPAATQLFTPDWIVRYMVENSLGRLWLEGHPNPELKSEWKYYLDEAEQEADVQAQLEKIREEYKAIKPEDIKVIDPCMGSGHILVYAFDVLMQIYEAAGYTQREAAKNILENNIYGLDIDDRAFQLAYFAVMMKARQYNRRILNGETVCHVYSIQESNTVNRAQLKYFGAGLNDLERNDAMNQITGLLDTFVDAKEYGSILNVDACNWDLLRRFIAETNDDGQMSLDSIGLENTKEQLCLLIEIGQVMAQKYDVVVTNPPYMGSGNMDNQLTKFVRSYYGDSWGDLSTCFMEKCSRICSNSGFISMINIPVWMFISAYEDLREKLIKALTLSTLVHFGRGIFGSDFGTVAFVLANAHIKNYTGVYLRLFDKQGSVDSVEVKERRFLDRDKAFYCHQEDFTLVTSTPIAYWVSDNFRKIFTYKNIGDSAEVITGMTTGKNTEFLRLWHEIDISKAAIAYANMDVVNHDGKYWIPYSKGGDRRNWYGNGDYLVNWSRKDEFNRSKTTLQHLYLKPAVTWPFVTSGIFSARYLPEGYLWDVAGSPCFFEKQSDLLYTLGFLCSRVANDVLRVVNPTINVQAIDIQKMPLIVSEIHEQEICGLVKTCIELSKRDWDDFEHSWDFSVHPFIKYGNMQRTVEESNKRWEDIATRRFNEVKELEIANNEYFVEIYQLKGEVNVEIPDNEIAIRRPDLMRDIKSFISYAVGCMFGRYSLDTSGLVYAGGEWDVAKYSSYVPDEDNILPITDEEYFQDDIVGLFCGWLKKVYGEDTLEANLDFIAKALGNKGNTSREIIRNYFLNDFFNDHCSTYSVTGSGKRPIYWLFDSGKQNGFKALIYMHRYDENTIGNLRIDYLHRMERVYESEIARMQDIIDNSRDGREVTKATKRKEKLQKQIKECKEYDEKIAHLALARIPIDLDDGVKVNYEKVQTVDGKKYPVLAKI